MNGRGFTVADLAIRYRVGQDKIRTWIKIGELKALTRSATRCGKPSYVVTPESLAQFEEERSVAPPPKQKRQRKKRKTEEIDFYPD